MKTLRLVAFSALASIATLAAITTLPADHAAAQVRLRRPYDGTFTLNKGMDHNRASGAMRDYTCGTSLCYDNHSGTDFRTPYGTDIVAAAAGTVNYVFDGCADYGSIGNTCGGRSGNHVRMTHADGTVAVYAHLRRGSLRVAAGQRVTCGQVLGQSASSGNSSGPHLHISLYPGWYTGAPSYDPFVGACSSPPNRWSEQYPHPTAPSASCTDTPPVPPCDRTAAPFTFSCDGANAGLHCVLVDEPADPDSWADNHLCSMVDLGVRWSVTGPIAGMTCVNVTESAEAHAAVWSDNHLCVPNDAAYQLRWSSAGPIAGWSCVHWNEPADPHSWSDNHLCATRITRFSAGDFTFSERDPVPEMHCVSVDEPSDPNGWADNHFCSSTVDGMRWSTSGPIDGMSCVNVTESSDEHATQWSDNYLCLPSDAPYEMRWSSAGPIDGWTCVRWYEGADLAGTWGDNYLCFDDRPIAADGGIVDAGWSGPIDAGLVEPVDASPEPADASAVRDGSIRARDAGVDREMAGLDSGCGCAVPGRPSRQLPGAAPVLVALLALVLGRRRRRAP